MKAGRRLKILGVTTTPATGESTSAGAMAGRKPRPALPVTQAEHLDKIEALYARNSGGAR